MQGMLLKQLVVEFQLTPLRGDQRELLKLIVLMTMTSSRTTTAQSFALLCEQSGIIFLEKKELLKRTSNQELANF
ncbi:hypothetical protein KBB17_02200 [Candidatus Saccharibacteria bacterium]|jgi:hypothetical protein|nr:hypothetical protein [Candidatus Saccharibacteria bacterium]MBP9132274.1 hypothetical protein [Candidatus Saccharibacteria bacterium]